jgi:outer membrane protein
MQHKFLAAMMVSAGLFSVPTAHAEGDGSWMVRARAVGLDWKNGQADNLAATAKVEAVNRTIPELDISYFFTKNIAVELVLTVPQKIDINVNGTKNGTIKALPPSLLLQYHFSDLGNFKPYVGGGINYTLFSDRNNILNRTASVDKSSSGLVAQLGFDYALTKNVSFNFDLKYAKMDTDVKLNGAKIGKLNLDPTMIGIGIGYRF